MVDEYNISKEIIMTGEKERLFRIREDKVEYIAQRKSYKISDPEEQVRIAFYFELIQKYQYPKERIDFEVIVPRREPTDKADIVVYEDDENKKTYIVVECKPDGISQAEIKQAIEQVFGNANSLRAKYAILVAGSVRIAFDVAGFPPEEREKNIIADIPVRYSKVIKFKYKKGDRDWDLRKVTRNELLAKFQQCHDTLWEGGKRNPAEAFDEMSKLMFCKVHDERFLTKKGEHYSFQVGTHESISEVIKRIRDIYEDAQRIDPDVFVDPIKAENPIIYGVVEILQGVSLSKTDLDVKGVAFEHFLGAVFRGEMGQYFTPRTIVEFMVSFLNPTVNDLIIDPACGSGGFLIYILEKVRRELESGLEPQDARDRWKDFGLKQVFGIEINSQLARVSMMNMIIHEDGHTNIENHDSLDFPQKWGRQKIREHFGKKFNLLLTNPPFGAFIREREKAYFAKYELGSKIKKRSRQNTEILFIERCLAFLKPGGRMGIVLPDGLLTNSTLQYARDFIIERARILGVVSLPQTAFTHYGSGVKASLVFLTKKKNGEKLPENYPIFMAIAEHIGYDATGRTDKNEFPEILEAWKEFSEKNKIEFFHASPICFTVGRGELEGRIDVNYYKPEYRAAYEKLKKSPFRLVKLKKLLKEPPQYGANERAIDGNPNDDVRYIRITDVDNFGNLKYDDWKTAPKIEEKYLLQDKDILFARSGATVGKSFIYKEEYGDAIFAGYMIKFKIDDDKANPYYVFYYTKTNLYNKWVASIQRPSGQPNINSKEFENLLILLPPIEIQDHIAKIMDDAYIQKKEKEAKAKRLLNSIESYILEELCIKMSEMEEEKTPKVFSATVNMVDGGRLDPFYYEPEYKRIKEAISGGKYEAEILNNLVLKIASGQRPKGGVRRTEGEVYSLGGEHLNAEGNIVLEKPRFISQEFHNKYRESWIESEDILIVKDGATTGKTAFVSTNSKVVKHNINEHLFKLYADRSKVWPFYLFLILYHQKIGQKQIKKGITGSTQFGLTKEIFKNILVPLPPLAIQQRLATEVWNLRQQAGKLKQDAREILAKAKENVEKMILGENND